MAEFRVGAIAIPGLSALAGGAVGALLTLAVVRGNESSADTRARPEPLTKSSQPTQSSADERVASLERSLRALELKGLARAAAQPVGSTPRGTEIPPVADVAPIVDNPVFEAAVRDVMERAEQERNLERESQRAEWRKRTAEEWSSAVGEKLRLTEIQKAKAAEIAQAFWDRLHDLRQTDAGPPPSRQERREQVATLRRASEAELAKILDPSQLTTYSELDEAEKLGSNRSLRAAPRGP
ncbi:MAG TPA: hypothetical protein VEX18_03075 [Polyangiaceae bacterium]|nr:hypothetical protein [Polyangiaceae bacterium]